MDRWLLHFLGLDSASGPAYLAWSGALSDLGELVLIGGLYAFLRRHNCMVRRCWRLGWHPTAAGHVTCRHHHPDAAPTHAEVIAAHHAARERNRPGTAARAPKTLIRKQAAGTTGNARPGGNLE